MTGGCWEVFVFTVLMRIQGDLGEKVRILVGDSVGHCEKSSYEHCLLRNSNRDIAL